MFKSGNALIILISLTVVGAVSYLFLFKFGNNNDQDPLLKEGLQTSSQQAQQAMIQLLADINSIKLDVDFVHGLGFKSLSDSNVEILTEPIGRLNPFLPFAQENVSAPALSGGPGR